MFHLFVLTKPASLRETLALLQSINRGEHVNNECCQVYRCNAFRLEHVNGNIQGSIDDIPVSCRSIQGNILPRSCRVFCGNVFEFHQA